jgi:carboxypeptidase Q
MHATNIMLRCVVAALVLTATTGAGEDSARLLVDHELGQTQLLSDLKELCDRMGGRPTGAASCDRAVDWGVAKFKAAKVDSVVTESFTVPSLWLPDTVEASCLGPVSFPIRIAAAPYSASTKNKRPFVAKLVDVGEGNAKDFQKVGARASGSIVLVHSKEMKTLEDLDAEYLHNLPLIRAAQEAKVAAILLQSTRPRGLLYRHPVSVVGKQVPLPIAIVSREHAERLARLTERGEVQLRMRIANKISGPYQSRNVVAEIRGQASPNEIVLIGAHLDSWDLGTGANDNGVNAVTVIELARALKDLRLTHRRTIRFVLFTGEEQGMFGSAGYVKTHAKELDQHVAMVNFDVGSGRTTGFYLNGRSDLQRAIDTAFSAFPEFAFKNNTTDGADLVDSFPFLLCGIPNFLADQDATPYLPDYHAESDVFEMVDPREAKRNAAIAAALVWSLAEVPVRPATRQTADEVEKLLIDTKTDQQMKEFGQWDDWTKTRHTH